MLAPNRQTNAAQDQTGNYPNTGSRSPFQVGLVKEGALSETQRDSIRLCNAPRGPTLRGMPLEQAQRHYSGEAGRHYHQVKRGIPQEALPWVVRLRARKFSEFVRPDDIVLEYGVGSGWNLTELRCRRKIGFDISTEVESVVRELGIEFVTDTVSISDGIA